MTTFCKDCDYVAEDTRKRHPSQWLCLKHKRLEGHGFVDPDYWAEHEPYLKCVNVNGGACPLFEPRRRSPNGDGLVGKAD